MFEAQIYHPPYVQTVAVRTDEKYSRAEFIPSSSVCQSYYSCKHAESASDKRMKDASFKRVRLDLNCCDD